MRKVLLKDINLIYNEEETAKIDERFNSGVLSVAEKIMAESVDKPVVLLSGPSGSGKTTVSLMLEKIMDEAGFETHVISLDNYFKTIKPEERKILDYESPERVDGELLTKHINSLLKCEKVEIPYFDFLTTSRRGISSTIERKDKEIIIFEGIHALNDDLINIDKDKTTKIYVSVDTTVDDNGKEITPSKIRLLRRSCRDKLYRGRELKESFEFFDSVERGEKSFIAPYKHRADVSLDTFIDYELSVEKGILFNDLFELSNENSEIGAMAKDLIKKIEKIKRTDKKEIRKTSLINEFIG